MKKGYNMHITSWENDADFYNTKVIVVDTLEEVRFYNQWLKLFYSQSGSRDKELFGNSDIPRYQTPNPLDELFADLAIGNMLKDIVKSDEGYEEYYNELCEGNSDTVSDLIYDALGSAENGDYYRVFESMEVYWFDKDIEPLNPKRYGGDIS